ncbi:hypothetical protein GQR58_001019 [Nymphon striatum]|nr:hypothetical protein GQR58_001019 [Nymphon striatum]
MHRGRRRRPLFHHTLWKVHGRVVDELPRTNNSLEGWHNSFDRRVVTTHPTIRRLVAKLLKEQAYNEILLEQFSARIQQTNSVTNAKKTKVWKEITDKLNARADGQKRTVEQVKKKWRKECSRAELDLNLDAPNRVGIEGGMDIGVELARLSPVVQSDNECNIYEIETTNQTTDYTDTESPDNAFTVKMFQSLAFYTPDMVTEVYDELIQSLVDEMDEVLADFLIYFEATWIGVMHRGRRRRPPFHHTLWKVHGRVVDDLPRTNNSLEGWHNSFDRRVVTTHPTIRRLVAKLLKEQAYNEILLKQFSARIQTSLTILCELVENNIDIIQSTQTNSVTNAKKTKVWKEITDKLNVRADGQKRTVEQVKEKWRKECSRAELDLNLDAPNRVGIEGGMDIGVELARLIPVVQSDNECNILYEIETTNQTTDYTDNNEEKDIGTVSKNNRRYVRLTAIWKELGPDLCAALSAFHAFTGSDYTSAFVRKGKVRLLKALEKQPDYQKSFRVMVTSTTVSNRTKAALQRFTATMYGAKDSTNTRLNEWRYEKFMKTYGPKGNGKHLLANLKGMDASGLPPCEDELNPHIKRASFVANMWARADQNHIEQHATEENGWQLVDDHYKLVWFEGEQLPDSLIPETEELEVVDNEEEDDMDIASSDEDGSSDEDD